MEKKSITAIAGNKYCKVIVGCLKNNWAQMVENNSKFDQSFLNIPDTIRQCVGKIMVSFFLFTKIGVLLFFHESENCFLLNFSGANKIRDRTESGDL